MERLDNLKSGKRNSWGMLLPLNNDSLYTAKVNIAVAFYTNDLPSQGLRVNQLAAKKFLVSRLLLYQICDSEDWGVLTEKYIDMFYRYICKKKYFLPAGGSLK